MLKLNRVARAGAVVATLIATSMAGADDKAAAPAKLLPPPYVIMGVDGVQAGVTWDEAVIKAALPKGLTAAKEMTGGINIYKVSNAYGTGVYSAAYLWVDLEGADTPDGSKGRYILAGVYGPQQVVSSFDKFYGVKVRTGGSRQEATAAGVRGVGSFDGKDLVSVDLKVDSAKCAPAAGGANYLSVRPGSNEKLKLEIGFAGTVCPAEPVSARVIAPAGDPFAKFQPKSVTWAVRVQNASAALAPAIKL